MSDVTPEQAANTIRENVVHIARGCLSGRSHDPTFYEREIAAALKVLEDAANGRYSQADLDFAHDNTDEYFDKWRAAVARAEQAERKLGEASAVNAHAYEGLRQFAIAETARAETLTQALEEAHVLVVTASVAFGSPVVDEARQELWDKARARGWVVTEQNYTGDYQTRITGEGERALAAALENWTIIGPLAYQGKKDCQDARCTRRGFSQNEDGSWEMGECIGWHCSYCDQPCSSQGHRCDASEAILGEARRLSAEPRP